MEKEDRAILLHISNTLDKVLEAILKPQNRLIRVFEFVALGVTLLGILGAIDIIMTWIGG